MHPQFLKFLCCPDSGEPLALRPRDVGSNGDVISGDLINVSGRRYSIIRGVPRFVNTEPYVSSFGYEWNRWPRVQFEEENVGGTMAGHTTRMWEIITGIRQEDVRGKAIIEFGCGPGRFLDVVRRKGGLAIGVDMSLAVEAARHNFGDDPNILIVQADLIRPPFREGAFDGGFSIGVLHHTPEPARGLQSLAKTVRAGGWIACCVYPRGEFYDYPSVARFRRVHASLKPVLGYAPAMAYTYFSACLMAPIMTMARRLRVLSNLVKYVERNWLVLVYIPDIRWRLLDTFDAITPSIATTHTSQEVQEWMREAGCATVRTTPWCATACTGRRRFE